MTPIFWLVFVLLGAFLLLLIPLLRGWVVFHEYSGVRRVTCPENLQPVAITFSALHAAWTRLGGRTEIELCDCTRWPERAGCDQRCIHDALRAQAFTAGEAARPRSKRIYHLPVLIGAFAGWLLGATWHSPYAFRNLWMAALGITRLELRSSLLWLPGHFLTVGVCLLFAYWVAAVLAWRRRSGAWQGMMTASVLWLAVAAATAVATLWEGIAGELVAIEYAYTVIAAVVIGAVVGGLTGKVAMPATEKLASVIVIRAPARTRVAIGEAMKQEQLKNNLRLYSKDKRWRVDVEAWADPLKAYRTIGTRVTVYRLEQEISMWGGRESDWEKEAAPLIRIRNVYTGSGRELATREHEWRNLASAELKEWSASGPIRLAADKSTYPVVVNKVEGTVTVTAGEETLTGIVSAVTPAAERAISTAA